MKRWVKTALSRSVVSCARKITTAFVSRVGELPVSGGRRSPTIAVFEPFEPRQLFSWAIDLYMYESGPITGSDSHEWKDIGGGGISFDSGHWYATHDGYSSGAPLSYTPDYDVVAMYSVINLAVGSDLEYIGRDEFDGHSPAGDYGMSSTFSATGIEGRTSNTVSLIAGGMFNNAPSANSGLYIFENGRGVDAVGARTGENLNASISLTFSGPNAPAEKMAKGRFYAWAWALRELEVCEVAPDGTFQTENDDLDGAMGEATPTRTMGTRTSGGNGEPVFGSDASGNMFPRITQVPAGLPVDTFGIFGGVTTGDPYEVDPLSRQHSEIGVYMLEKDKSHATLGIYTTPTSTNIPYGSGSTPIDHAIITLHQRNDLSGSIEHDIVNRQFVYGGSGSGTSKGLFNDFDPSFDVSQPYLKGKLIQWTDGSGKTAAVTSWHPLSSGPTETTSVAFPATMTFGYFNAGSASGATDTLTFHYSAVGHRIESATVTSGSQTIKAVEYIYDGGGHLSFVRKYNGATTLPVKDETFYKWNMSANLPQFTLGQEAIRRAVAGFGSLEAATNGGSYGKDTLAYVDSSYLAFYADSNVLYDSSRRIEYLQSSGSGIGCGCGVGNEGMGLTRFAYDTNTSNSGRNAWRYLRTQYLPDDTNGGSDPWADNDKEIIYANEFGQTLLSLAIDTSSGTVKRTWYRYDYSGNLVQQAESSAIQNVDPSFADLVHGETTSGGVVTPVNLLSASGGLIYEFEYATATSSGLSSSVSGDVNTYLKATYLRNGETGARIIQSAYEYFKVTGSDGTVAYPMASESNYPTGDVTGDVYTTDYTYTWFSGTTQMASRTVKMPMVSVAHNGVGDPNARDTSVAYFDSSGHLVWEVDAAKFLTYYKYDGRTGSLLQHIQDADPSLISSPAVSITRDSSLPTALHLVTTYEIDSQGRTKKATEPNGNITITVYDDTEEGSYTFRGQRVGGTWVNVGSVEISRMHYPTGGTLQYAGGPPQEVYEERLTVLATPALDSSGWPVALSSSAITTGTITSLVRSFTNHSGQLVRKDTYSKLAEVSGGFSVAKSRLGAVGTEFSSENYAYDTRGRLAKTVTPNGTITRSVYDGIGRLTSQWVGTDDTVTGTWDAATLNVGNLLQVSGYAYDDSGTNAGNGNVSEVKTFAAPNRYTINRYDWRDRLVLSKVSERTAADYLYEYLDPNVSRQMTVNVYDNLDRVVETRQYDGALVDVTEDLSDVIGDNTGRRRARATVAYDEQGRVFDARVFSVNPVSGAINNQEMLKTSTWYDSRGNVIKTLAPGGLTTKYSYGGAGRNAVVYQTDGKDDPSPGAAGNWTAASSVSDDNVLEQSETAYDLSGNVILSTLRQRLHNDNHVGALGNPSSTGTTPKARVSYSAYFYDGANRLTDTANVGVNSGTSYARPTSAPTASTSTLLLSHVNYDIQGTGTDYAGLWGTEAIDPAGVKSRRFTDLKGQTIWTIDAYDPTGTGEQTVSTNRRTQYAYDGSGHVVSMKAYTTQTAAQETTYLYGVTIANGSSLNNLDMLFKVTYPSVGGTSEETFAYDREGKKKVYIDRNGTVHTYTYDQVARLKWDRVNPGSGISSSVLATAYSYDSAGRVAAIRTYDTSVTASFDIYHQTSYITRFYNGYGQLTTEGQNSGSVQYIYSNSNATNVGSTPNASRITDIIYPGKHLKYVYDTGVDNAISRLSGIESGSYVGVDTAPGSTVRLEGYAYLGLSTVVQRQNRELASSTFTGTTTVTTYAGQTLATTNDGTNTATGDIYVGLDNFGRVQDQRWVDGSGADQDRYSYAYDLNSNPVSKTNTLATSHSEFYSYDVLNRLTGFERGTLSTTGPGTTSPTRTQGWNLDSLGNWSSLNTNGTLVARTHNAQNQLVGIGTGGSAVTLTYDQNGNQTTDEDGNHLAYDAWNRLATWTNKLNTTTITYSYDAMGRRIGRTEATGSTSIVTSYTFSDQWQVLTEWNAAGEINYSYVWSPVYVDAMVLRDQVKFTPDAVEDFKGDYNYDGIVNAADYTVWADHYGQTGTNVPGDGNGDGTVDAADYTVWADHFGQIAPLKYFARVYTRQDANYNLTSIVAASGTGTITWSTAERYEQDAYGGNLTVMNSSFVTQGTGFAASGLGWSHYHQGGRADVMTGLMTFRMREYDPNQGRWVQEDPLRYVDGGNTFGYAMNSPIGITDPTGLLAFKIDGQVPPIPNDDKFPPVPAGTNLANLKTKYIGIATGMGLTGGAKGREALLHYLDGTGTTLIWDGQDILNTSPKITRIMKVVVEQAKEFVEDRIGMCGEIKFAATSWGAGEIPQGEAINYWYAMRGFAYSGEGSAVQVHPGEYRMNFTFMIGKRYNYDPGEVFSHPVMGIPMSIGSDELVWLATAGIAKPFDIHADVTKTYTWKRGSSEIN